MFIDDIDCVGFWIHLQCEYELPARGRAQPAQKHERAMVSCNLLPISEKSKDGERYNRNQQTELRQLSAGGGGCYSDRRGQP